MSKKSKLFFSNAKWTKIKNSHDSHLGFEFARGVCESLLYRYGIDGHEECEIRGRCLKTWVTDQDGYCHFDSSDN